MFVYPKLVMHWMDNGEFLWDSRLFEKFNPATGAPMAKVAGADEKIVDAAIGVATVAFDGWRITSLEKRVEIIRNAAKVMDVHKEDIAGAVALEAGWSKKRALSDVKAAIQLARFWMSWSRDIGQFEVPHGLSTDTPNRLVYTMRVPRGVCVAITPFNTPFSGVARKIFPAILCGNTVVQKSHELTPYSAIMFAQVLKEAGLPSGVFSVVQGLGKEIGSKLVTDPCIACIAFTGSQSTGEWIAKNARTNLVQLELGGKNPLVVCGDADIDHAVSSAIASAFVDSGQRCAAASRIIIFDSVYDVFRKRFIEKMAALRPRVGDDADFGPVISLEHKQRIERVVTESLERGGTVYEGGNFSRDNYEAPHTWDDNGYYVRPKVIENISPLDSISRNEIFGPVTSFFRVSDYEEALALANDSEYGLTAAIHTKNKEWQRDFTLRCQSGVVRVNGPTHGSEPHMPFVGIKASGNGWADTSDEAIKFYSQTRQISEDTVAEEGKDNVSRQA